MKRNQLRVHRVLLVIMETQNPTHMRNLAIQCQRERIPHYERIFSLTNCFNLDFFESLEAKPINYKYSTLLLENRTGEGLLHYKELMNVSEYMPKTLVVQSISDIKLGIEFARLGVEGLVTDQTHPLDIIEITKKVDFGGIYYGDAFIKEILKNLQLETFRHELSVA